MCRVWFGRLGRAFALGAVVGVLAAVGEGWARAGAWAAEAIASYALLGGLLTSGARVLGRGWGRAGAFASVGVFISIPILYFVNVRLLPGDHYLSGRSLGADVLALTPVLALIYALGRSRRPREAHPRWQRLAAMGGLGLFGASSAVLFAHWPGDGVVALPGRGDGPNLLLIVLDSARHDRLGLDGYPRPTSPALDAVAARARVFERAYAESSWTVPSVTAIMRSRVAGGVLPERLLAHGYRTGCFTDNPHLRQGSVMLAGFQRVARSVGNWRSLFRATTLGEALERVEPGDDTRLVDRAVAWAERAPGPVFLYVHLMDSHAPYRFPAIDGKRRPGRHIEFPYTGFEMTPDEAEDVIARYEGGVRSADAAAGRLLSAAKGWGRPFVAIVTADHGESLGESGRWFHDRPLTPELLHVPLLVLGEGVVPGRVADHVGHASIAATLLAAAGVASDPSHDLRTEQGEDVVQGSLPPSLAYRIADGYKVIVGSDGGPKLFDLEHDPLELRDAAADHPKVLEVLSRDLVPDRAPPRALPEAAAEAAEIRARLRSLGYLQ